VREVTTIYNLEASPAWEKLTRAVLGFVIGLSIWPYGYYWGGKLFVLVLGYHPIFETPPMQFVSCITAGIISSITAGVIFWNKKLFPLLVATMAAAVVFSKHDPYSTHWTMVDLVAVALGFVVVPLFVVIFEFLSRRNTENDEQ